MAWLQKRPQVALPINYITVGQNSVLMLIGLGNPEPQYNSTRHNVGFECLDFLVNKNEEMSDWVQKKDLKCYFSSGRFGDSMVIAIKPTTFMNLSGDSVALASSYYKVQLDHLVVIHDELDIKFGKIRTCYGGSDAGHNGIKSITNKLGEDYGRVRIGIGPKSPIEIDSADYVLQSFSAKEQKQLENMKRECSAILSEFIYNKKLASETRSFIV
jgi:PTH1 family peptidyl-tRNA hydrolase